MSEGTGVVLRVGAATDVGYKRSLNEDAYLAQAPVFLVADGMGGHEAGELASAAVIDAFTPLAGVQGLTSDDVVRALASAHDRVAELSATTARGAGTTVTGAAVVEHEGLPHWLIFNLGDSRVYRFDGSVLSQITVDHSLVQEMVDLGQLTPEEAQNSAQRNVITRAVGAEDSDPDFWLLPVVNGERFLICSDGLTGEVPSQSLQASLTLACGVQETADSLVQLALANGGRDNVTVIVLDVVDGGLSFSERQTTAAIPTSGELPDESTNPSRATR